MWKEGSIKVNGEIFHYWMKQYEGGSHWGIEGGRISKLVRHWAAERLDVRKRHSRA